MGALVLRFLGGFAAQPGDKDAHGFESDKARALLAYLAVEAGRPQRRETLAGLFWPELTERAARGNLRRVLANVRDVIDDRDAEPPFLLITRQSIQFNESSDYWLDTAELERAVKSVGSGTESLEMALAGVGGDFLAGFSIPDSASFEQWLLERRGYYRQLVFRGLEQLVNRYEARGDWDAALGAARRQLAVDPTREEGQRQVIRLLALMGDRSGALAQYQNCRAVLDEELGVEPEEATTALYEQVRDGRLEYVVPAPWGKALRGYELREQIGSGAFGIVYRAYQPVVDRQVAIKVIRPEFANRPNFIRRFEAEARLVARLDHLHIVPLYDYWREPDGAYLVMPWLRGGSLQGSLRNSAWPLQQVALLLDQIAGALAYAHQRGVVHGDVRAENILLDEAGNAFLSDFGIARDQLRLRPLPPVDQMDTTSGSVLAISPEQASGSPASPQSDQYCLGLVLFQALTGKSPLAGKTPREQLDLVGQPLPLLAEVRPDLDADIDFVLRRSTAKEPEARFEDMRSMAIAFRAAIGEEERLVVSPDGSVEAPVNPYKGLRPFAETDAGDFFGREALVQQLLARMGENGDLLAVIGPSGSGKSSVVNAGLIPALRAGALPGSALWFVAYMVPGAWPLRELEMALRQVAASWPERAEVLLRENDQGLWQVARLLLPENEDRLLLVVDQFEELYTRAQDTREVEQFLRLLAAAAESGDVSLVITLRADFYDRPLLHHQFSRVLRGRTEVVLPMSRQELLEAVRCPAERAGVHFAPGVAEEIVETVYEEPGTLPILQYALTELFDKQENWQIDREGYEAIGGVTGALAGRAEGIYRALDEAGQEAARQIFLRLVALGEGTEDTRRRVLRSELEGISNQLPVTSDQSTTNDQLSSVHEDDPSPGSRQPPAAVDMTSGICHGTSEISPVIDSYGRARLLTFDRDPATRSPTVEIAHEALLKEWPRLAAWLEENRDDVRLGRRLTAAVGEWTALGRDPGLLAGGTRLVHYKALAASGTLALTADEEAYVAASVAAEEVREARARRTRNLLRGLGIGASVAAVVAIFLALLALNQRATALREAEVNRSIVLATIAEEALGAGEVDRALALALEAVDIEDPPPEAVSKLAEIAYGRGTKAVLSGHSSGVRAADFSPDGQEVLSGSCLPAGEAGQCGAGELIRWNLETGEELARWTGHHSGVTAVAWHPGGERAFTGGGDGSLIIWDMTRNAGSNTAVVEQQLQDSAINAIVFSPDQTVAALAGAGGIITLIDTASGAIIEHFHGHDSSVQDVAFSPDGQQLLSGDIDGLVILWDTLSGETLQTFSGHTRGVSGVGFVDEGTAIVTGSYDQNVRKWDIVSGELLQLRESGDTVDEMAFSPDGSHIIHTSSHLIYAWDLEQFDGVHQKLIGHEMMLPIKDLAFSADGRLALSASEDGTVRVWDLGGSDILQTSLGFPALAVDVSPDGTMLVIGSWGPEVILWDVAANEARQTLSLPPSYVNNPGTVSFSADGRYIAAGGGEVFLDTDVGGVRVWEVASGELICEFQDHLTVPRTLTFGPQDLTLLSGSMADWGDLLYWDARTCKTIHRLPTDEEFSGVDISADGKLGLSSNGIGRLELWNLEVGELVRYYEIPNDFLIDAAFGPEDETVLAAAISGIIVQWDRETGEEMRRFIGHDGGAWALSVSSDGRWLASSDDAGQVILWDLNNGALMRRHNVHDSQVFHLVFSSDDQTVYSVSVDETLVAWKVGDPSLEGTLTWIENNRYARELTCEERAQFGVEPLCD